MPARTGPARSFAWPALVELLALVALLCLRPASAFGYVADRVVIIVVDGARDSEFLEQPGHANTPHLWNELRPQGYLSHAFYNQGTTKTVASHATILCGATQVIAETLLTRPTRPTLFEYLREARALPDSAAVIMSYKDKLAGLTWSEAPGYGPADSALFCGPSWNDAHSTIAWTAYAAAHHPVASLLAFGWPDPEAHQADWAGYNTAIRTADSLVAVVWNWIESTPEYANRTALFVTNDHGRHRTDWQNHGDGCDGCRHIAFLALGPDFLSGVEAVGPAADQRDIAVTAAAILGIPAPFCEGRFLAEIFANPASVPPGGGAVSSLRLVAWPNPARDRLHLQLSEDGIRSPIPTPWLMTLHDAMGRRLAEHEFDGVSLARGTELSLPASLPAGSIWIRLAPRSGSGAVVGKRIVRWAAAQDLH